MNSSEPKWILDTVALAIHDEQLAVHGGKAGILNDSALDASLANPKQFFHYTEPKPEIPAIAARYAFSIATSHPFEDGNKRTAAVVCETFLMLNGYMPTASEEDAYAAYLNLASGDMDVDQFTEWLQGNVEKV